MRGFKILLKTIGTLCLVGILSVSMLFGIFVLYINTSIMSSEKSQIDLSQQMVNLSSTIWYNDPNTGEPVKWLQLANRENRKWVEFEDLPVDFQHAFVAIEDERFYQHQGVDWKRTVAAALNVFSSGHTFGGSTITQQLIKNITNDREVTINRKVLEICRALNLEKAYSKDKIMEWYMNIIFFGHGQYGVGAAANYYFGKDVSELSLAQMCSIAGITNNPSLYDPYSFPENNKKRQELILNKMAELGYITESQGMEAKAENLEFKEHSEREKTGTQVYPYYVDAVIEDVIATFMKEFSVSEKQATDMLYYGGYNIYTCVDMNIQKKMDVIYQDRDQIPKTRDRDSLQSSMVVMDPYTGNIVGLEGGVGEKTVARGLNWATSPLGRRPPGSSFKPISTYAPAIENELITPDTVFMDSESVRLKGTDWMPQNSGRNYRGQVTVRQGLISSLNTIAAQIMDLLTPEASYEFLTEKLHMNLEPGDKDYAPLAVGQLNIGTTTREMASAFSIFPNHGVYVQGRTFSMIKDHKGKVVLENTPVINPAIKEKTAYWTTNMLEDAMRYGTGSGARLKGMSCAGKTGTSSDNRDRWFVGFTPYYVGAVWTGYEKPSSIRVSGNPAGKIWKNVMTSIHEDLPNKKFDKPEDVKLKVAKQAKEANVPYYVKGVTTNMYGTIETLYQEQVGWRNNKDTVTVQSKQLADYYLIGESTMTFQIKRDEPNTAIFYYAPKEVYEPPAVDVPEETYQEANDFLGISEDLEHFDTDTTNLSKVTEKEFSGADEN